MSQLGSAPIGESPLGDLPQADRQGAQLPYAAELEAATRELFMAVDIDSYDQGDGGLTTSRYATAEFVSQPDDTPANTLFEGRLGGSFSIQRKLPTTNGFFGGVIKPSFSELEIDNVDGGANSLLDRAIDGRVVTLRAGKSERIASNAWLRRMDQAGVILRARSSQWTGDGTRIRIPLRDITEQLNKPAQVQSYAGDGGPEGNEALAGRTKPLLLGRGYNIQPTLINEGLNIYQVSVGPIESIDAIRDSGLTLSGAVSAIGGGYDELASFSPEQGGYTVSLSSGMVRLGSPPAGVVTCDAKGVILDRVITFSDLWEGSEYWDDGTQWTSTSIGPGYVETTAGIVRYLLVKALRWGRNVIDDGSFTLMDSRQSAPVGYFISSGSNKTVGQAIEDIFTGVGAYLIPTRLGKVEIGILEAPTGTAPLSLTETEVTRIERLPLAYEVPPYRWDLGYERNNRVMTDSEFVAAVTLVDRQIYSLESRTASAEKGFLKTRHLTSSPEAVETVFALKEGATKEAKRRLELYSTDRILLRVEVPIVGIYNQIGREVKLSHRAFGLAQGRNFRIVESDEDIGRNRATVTLFG